MLSDMFRTHCNEQLDKRFWKIALVVLVAASVSAAVYWSRLYDTAPLLLLHAVKPGNSEALKRAVVMPTDNGTATFVPEADLVARKPALLATNRCARMDRPFSQMGEDEYAWRNFLYGKRGGRFLELGAYNGCTFSNTLLLEAGAGWRGILIEASPGQSHTMRIMRPAAVCVNAGVCSAHTSVHYAEGGPVGGIVETMSKDFRRQWNVSTAGHQAITCLPLSNLMAHLRVRHLDFWSLDVEGGELSVLRTFDFQQVLVDVMVVETNTPTHFDSIVRLLADNGMQMVVRQDMNTWFIREGFTPSAEPASPAAPPVAVPPARRQ